MNILQNSQNYFDNEVSKILNTVFSSYEEKAFWCELTDFFNFEQEIKFRILKAILKIVGKKDYAPQADKILNLIEKINNPEFKASTLGDCHISAFDNKLWILPENPDNSLYSPKNWKEYLKNILN